MAKFDLEAFKGIAVYFTGDWMKLPEFSTAEFSALIIIISKQCCIAVTNP